MGAAKDLSRQIKKDGGVEKTMAKVAKSKPIQAAKNRKSS